MYILKLSINLIKCWFSSEVTEEGEKEEVLWQTAEMDPVENVWHRMSVPLGKAANKMACNHKRNICL